MSQRRFGERSISRWLSGRIASSRLLGFDDSDRLEILFRARRRFEQGAIQDAERLYELSLRIWPDSTDSILGMGACRQFSGDFESAIEFYERVLLLRAEDAHARTNLAECLILLGRHDEAHASLALITTAESKLRERIEALRRLTDAAVPTKGSL